MGKRIYSIVFIALFLAVLSIPLVFTDWSNGGVSEDENRVLAEFPALTQDGRYNEKFTSGVESWFMDHMGFRQEMITLNARIQHRVFSRMLDKSEYMIGRNGDINYATDAMLLDYVHLNLRTEEEVAKIGESYQTVSDWLAERNIPFYYVQCYDKHSVYPEQFIDTVRQIGTISKTDQVIAYLENETAVNTISMKEPLLEAKADYEVYSNWGDPTHWTQRGAYVGYRYLLERLNADFDGQFRVLQEADYNITVKDGGITLNKVIHQEDMLEFFEVAQPEAARLDKAVMGKWSEDHRHSVWKNENAGNDKKLLLMCDSYFNSFIVEDIAESFAEVWLVWGDYTADLPDIVELYQPDVVVYECAERVDRSAAICALAQKLKAE